MSAVQVSHQIWDQAWQMVETRKPAADMLFVYAVRTTGIYCRPSCPSRRPLRASVEFYATSELAERAGYRACKRCAPGQMHPQAHMLTQACDYIEQHLDNTIKLVSYAEIVPALFGDLAPPVPAGSQDGALPAKPDYERQRDYGHV